ncbi:MAG: glycosyltransferase [Chryseolinea sp.]
MAKILVAPLDWGLGHATRCVPIIQLLVKHGHDVTLSGSGDSLALLNEEFPDLKSFSLPAYAPAYSSSDSMWWKLLIQTPKFLAVIKNEHKAVESIVAQQRIDAIISDNRYGCWSSAIPSILITHQTNIRLPRSLFFIKALVRRLNIRLVSRFTQCWIPDNDGPLNLSGNLTRIKGLNPSKVKFIGNLSRFAPLAESETVYDVVFVLSGPEPQRKIFENIIVNQVVSTHLRYFIVRGIVAGGPALPGNISYADFLPTKSLLNLITRSRCIVARSGYSTIMDLAKLGKKAIFIPTPGQTEQEYLAKRVKKMKIAYSMPQHLFNLREAWNASAEYTGFFPAPSRFEVFEEIVLKNLTKLLLSENIASVQSHVKP